MKGSPAWVYVAFIVDAYSQRILAWHASTSKATDLVLTPLRMALWQRDHEGTPVIAADLIHHSDAGSQGGFQWSSQHLDGRGGFDGMGDGSENAAHGAAGDAVAGAAGAAA